MADHAAVKSLLESLPSGAPVYDGQVPNMPMFPYVLLRGGAGRPAHRSLNRTVHARSRRWRVTVAGTNSASVRIVLAQVQAALEGARIGVQRLEQLPTYEGVDPLMDEDVTLPDGSHPFYAVTEWQVMQ